MSGGIARNPERGNHAFVMFLMQRGYLKENWDGLSEAERRDAVEKLVGIAHEVKYNEFLLDENPIMIMDE